MDFTLTSVHAADQMGVARDDVEFVSCPPRFFCGPNVDVRRNPVQTPTHSHTHTCFFLAHTHMTDPGAVTFGKWVVPAHLQSVLWVHVDACLDRGVSDDVQDAEQRILSTLARR